MTTNLLYDKHFLRVIILMITLPFVVFIINFLNPYSKQIVLKKVYLALYSSERIVLLDKNNLDILCCL